MPKMKTDSGAKKRFKVTGSGKIRRRKVGMNHLLEKKAQKRVHRLKSTQDVAPGDVKAVKRLLGI